MRDTLLLSHARCSAPWCPRRCAHVCRWRARCERHDVGVVELNAVRIEHGLIDLGILPKELQIAFVQHDVDSEAADGNESVQSDKTDEDEDELDTEDDGQVGEKDALDLVEKDWLIVGETVFFASETPSYEEVKSAVQELAVRKQKI